MLSPSSKVQVRALRVLVFVQTLFLLASLFAPIPVMAADPSDPEATPAPTEPAATPDPTPEPDPTAAPDPIATPQPDQTAAPDPTADPDPTAEPAAPADPTASPDLESSADPTAEPSDQPSAESSAAPSAEPSAAPTATPGPTSPFIVTFVAGTPASVRADALAAAGADVVDSIAALGMYVLDVPAGSSVVAALRADASVATVEADRTREAEATPNDPRFAEQWALETIGWTSVFGSVTPAGNSVVAVLDTGVDASTPDLAGQLVAGTSILDGASATTDPNGHGTWMAGIIAAATDNGTGTAGVGYAGVRVMPVTVLGADGLGQDSDIIEGVVWAVQHGADVINMSFSNPGFSSALQAAIDYAWAHDVVVVAATGNDGSSSGTFPAGDRGVIGVSSTDRSDTLAPSSNYGPDVFLAAPGVDILTTAPGGGSTSISGTSASSAIVAAAAGLLRAADPGASNGVIVGRLARNADPAGSVAEAGNGRVNLARALGDTSNDTVKPEGAAPVGDGGPFVGPYVAAAVNVVSFTVGAQVGTAQYGTSTSVTYAISINGNGNGSLAVAVAGLPSGAGFSPTTNPPTGNCNANAGGGTGCNFTLTVTTAAANPAGTSSFTVTLDGKTANGQLTVTKAPLTVTADNKSRAYGDANPTLTASYTGFKNLETLATSGITGSPSLTTAAIATSPVSGSPYTITAALGTLAAGNYSFLFANGLLSVTKAPLTVTADNKSRAYGDANPAFTASFTGFKNSEVLATSGVTGSPGLTTAAIATSPVAGSPYTITAAIGTLAAGNYSFLFANGQLTVNRAVLIVVPDPQSRTYGQSVPAYTFSVTGFKNLENAGTAAGYTAPSCSSDYAPTTSVASSPRTISCAAGAADNYTFDVTATALLTISPATLTVTANDQTREYGQPNPALDATITGFKNLEILATSDVTGGPSCSTTATPTSPVSGSPYPITCALGTLASTNYTFSYVAGDLTVTQAVLTVTADDKTREYGQPNPAFTASYDGFRNGEVLATSDVTGSPSLSTTATPTSPVSGSPYAITAALGTLASGNYAFTFEAGSLTIGRATLVVTPDPQSRTYGQSAPAYTFSVTGFKNLETPATADGYVAPTCSSDYATTTQVAASPRTITCAAGAADNYAFDVTATALLTVTKATLSVDAQDASKTYGDLDPAIDYELSGFVNGEDATSAGVTGSPLCSRSNGDEDAGTYLDVLGCLPGTLDAANYAFVTGATADLTIDQAGSTVTVTCPVSEVYTGSAIEPCTASWTSTGADGETAALTVTYADNIVVGTATASATFAGDANHTGSSNSTMFAITQAPTTTVVTCPAGPYTYTGLAQTPCTVSVTGAALSLTPAASYADNVDAGIATASYAYGGDANHSGSGDSETFTIDPATLVVTPDDQTVTYGDPEPVYTFDVDGFVNGESGGTAAGYTAPTCSSDYTPTTAVTESPLEITCTLDAANYAFVTGATADLTIDQAGSTVTVTCPVSEVYTGSAIEPCTASWTSTGADGETAALTVTYADNIVVGTATASATFAGDANHTGSSNSTMFAITQAPTTTVVTCPAGPYTYTGLAQTPCTVSVTGAALSLTPAASYADNVDAGIATASYAYGGDANHSGSGDSETFTIDPAPSSTVVTCPASVPFTGAAQTPCTVSVTGAGGLSLTPAPSYSNNVGPGTATASYTYLPDANHTGSSDSKTFLITVVGATLKVTKIASDATVNVGDPFSYTITVTSTSASASAAFTVSDPLPPEVTFVSVGGPDASDCSQANGTVTCSRPGGLAAGASVIWTINVGAFMSGAPLNVATVTPTGPDSIDTSNPNGNAALVNIVPGDMTTDVATGDPDWQNQIDGVDTLFQKTGSSTSYTLKATNPGTFKYRLSLENETGIDIHVKGKQLPSVVRNGVTIKDTNGGSTTVYLTVPSLPTSVGLTIPASITAAQRLEPAFQLTGWWPVQAHPDDRWDSAPIDVTYIPGTGPSAPAWPAGSDCRTATGYIDLPSHADNVVARCIRVEGLDIPKHHAAHIHVAYEFRWKGTSGWGSSTVDPAQAFRAGFNFKSTTIIDLDDAPTDVRNRFEQSLTRLPSGVRQAYRDQFNALWDKTYTGSHALGLTLAGERMTAVGGFVFDPSGNGRGDVTVRVYSAPPSGDRCGTYAYATNNYVASYTTGSDGFYFIWQKGDNNNPGPTNNLASGLKYYIALCDQTAGGTAMPFAQLYWPARSMSSTLGNKEFDEEDFFVSGPTSLTYTSQAISGKVNKTLGTVKVALLDGFGNVMTIDTGGGASTISLSLVTPNNGGVLSSPTSLTKQLAQGVATWTDLKISSPAGTYGLRADSSVGLIPDELSLPINVTN